MALATKGAREQQKRVLGNNKYPLQPGADRRLALDNYTLPCQTAPGWGILRVIYFFVFKAQESVIVIIGRSIFDAKRKVKFIVEKEEREKRRGKDI